MVDRSGFTLNQEISDEVLCRRVAERDEAAFDLLVARYQGRAYRLAWSHAAGRGGRARSLAGGLPARLSDGGRASAETRASRPGSIACSSTCAWTTAVAAGGGGSVVRDALGDDPERAVLERQPAPGGRSGRHAGPGSS